MKQVKGKVGAPGIAQGTVVLVKKSVCDRKSAVLNPAQEEKRLNIACRQCKNHTQTLCSDLLSQKLIDEAKIIKAYRMILEDSSFINPIKKQIASGKTAEQAVQLQGEHLMNVFASMKTDYMRQRADDIRHVCQMLMDCLSGRQSLKLPQEPFILVAQELSPVDTLQMDRRYLAGIVTQYGGQTSHTVILAKTMGIPAVTGVHDVLAVFSDAKTAIVDGHLGQVVIDPDEAVTLQYQERANREKRIAEQIRACNYSKATTLDGATVQICANIGSLQDMTPLESMEYDGIGLFRTEFVFSQFDRLPTFKEQFEVYSRVVKKAAGRPVIFRTLDVGGDKGCAYFGLEKEENPFLGFRAVRICLQRQEVFLSQLMAILAASALGETAIMFPMITEMHELDSCKILVNKAKNRLREKGIPYDEQIRIGIMVETPACAILADRFAEKCDFFSIGTNDLTQYVTCTDRTNPTVQNLYNPYNPAVIRLLGEVLRSAHHAGIEAGVCGEVAGDQTFLPLLIGFGVSKLSMPPSLIEKVRYLICKMNQAETADLADQICKMDDPNAIKAKLSNVVQRLLD